MPCMLSMCLCSVVPILPSNRVVCDPKTKKEECKKNREQDVLPWMRNEIDIGGKKENIIQKCANRLVRPRVLFNPDIEKDSQLC